MSMTLTLTLDDNNGAYLERIASDQGRTPAEVATWIVTEDLRREQAIDEDIVARLGKLATAEGDGTTGTESSSSKVVRREHVGA
jgi:predicted transcriptional regulator